MMLCVVALCVTDASGSNIPLRKPFNGTYRARNIRPQAEASIVAASFDPTTTTVFEFDAFVNKDSPRRIGVICKANASATILRITAFDTREILDRADNYGEDYPS